MTDDEKEGCGPPFFITGEKDPLHEQCVNHDRRYTEARKPDGRYNKARLRLADQNFQVESWEATNHSVMLRLQAGLYLALMTPWRWVRNRIRFFIP